MSGMTDRDHFAAAALVGLLAGRKFTALDDAIVAEAYAEAAYGIADAMLRERANHIPDAGKMVETPTNLDAAPAARAPEPEPEAARRRPAGGTGDTTHDAAPAVKASVDSVAPQPTTHGESDRTDKAAPRPSEGTGDTPKPISGCVSDRPKPINGPDPDSRVWETPVHTPATHATPGEGSEQRECTAPVAWGVAGLGGISATSTSRTDAVDMQSEYEFVTEVIPLYRQAPDFAPPPPDNAAKAPDNAEPVAWAVMMGDGSVYEAFAAHQRDEAVELARQCLFGADGPLPLAPLYRHPPCQDASQKNLTLTDAEREAVERASIAYELLPTEGAQQVSATLRGLLERLR